MKENLTEEKTIRRNPGFGGKNDNQPTAFAKDLDLRSRHDIHTGKPVGKTILS
jgi:hypothetical protein